MYKDMQEKMFAMLLIIKQSYQHARKDVYYAFDHKAISPTQSGLSQVIFWLDITMSEIRTIPYLF